MNVRVEKPKRVSYWKPLIAVLVIAVGFILWVYLAPRSYKPLAFEILGIEGNVQISDPQGRSWRTPKRGEEFKVSQSLKTGPDGMVDFQIENEIHLRLKENSELKAEELRIVGRQEIYKLRLIQGVLLGATTRQFEHKQNIQKTILQILTRDYTANIQSAIFRVQAAGLFRVQADGKQGLASKVGVLRGSVEVSKPSFLFHSEGVRVRGLEEALVVNGVVLPATRVTSDSWGLMKESYELITKTAATEAEQIDLSKMAGNFFNVVFDHGTFFTPKIGYAGREFFKDPDSGNVYLETEYDVFPAGSFCGVYIKTRDFDISKYTGLSFEVRRKTEEGAPDSFFIELKSRGNVVRRYAPRTFENAWKPVEFDFHATKPLDVNEVVFVFTNSRVGEAKKGVLEFRNIKLIPLPEASATVPQGAAQAAVVPPSQPTVNQPVPSSVAPQAPAPAKDASLSVPKEVSLE